MPATAFARSAGRRLRRTRPPRRARSEHFPDRLSLVVPRAAIPLFGGPESGRYLLAGRLPTPPPTMAREKGLLQRSPTPQVLAHDAHVRSTFRIGLAWWFPARRSHCLGGPESAPYLLAGRLPTPPPTMAREKGLLQRSSTPQVLAHGRHDGYGAHVPSTFRIGSA